MSPTSSNNNAPPLDLLKRLQKMHDGLGNYLTAAALAEGGDPEGARELLDKKGGTHAD